MLPLVNVKCFFGFGASLKPLEKQVESSALVLLHGVIDMMLPITLNCGYPINNSLVLRYTPASPWETLLT